MNVFTIRILNTTKFYGKDNYIYAFKYKYQAYKTINKWFIKQKDIPSNIIEIIEHSIDAVPSTLDIIIPRHHVGISCGDFISAHDVRDRLEELYDL